MNKRWAIAAGILAATTIGAAGVSYADLITVNVPAPPSTAEATALDVGGIVGVGHTEGTSGQSVESATANAVELGGKPLIGGTQNGVGTNAGALLDTKQTPLGRVEVAPHDATVAQPAPGKKTSNANAAAARANVINPDTASVDVLQSSSNTSWENAVSRASSSSDALVLNLGGADGLTLKVLHSESSSDGHGLTYVLSINDQPLISIDELGRQICAIDLGDLLDVSCLAVTGGIGSVTTSALDATVGGANGLNATAIKAAGSGGSALTNTVDNGTLKASTSANAAPSVLGNQVDRGAASGGLARTGAQNVLFYASLGLALMLLGAALLRTRVVLMSARR